MADMEKFYDDLIIINLYHYYFFLQKASTLEGTNKELLGF